MPPGLMSRRKSRHLVWGMGIGESGLGIGQQESASAGKGSSKPIIPIAPPEPL